MPIILLGSSKVVALILRRSSIPINKVNPMLGGNPVEIWLRSFGQQQINEILTDRTNLIMRSRQAFCEPLPGR
jgi:hypothetical protein